MLKFNFDLLKKYISESNSFLVLLPTYATLDEIAAGLGLVLSLNSLEKVTTILYPDEISVRYNRLIGIDLIKEQLVKNNLFVDLNYKADLISKVDTQINKKSGSLELVVQPFQGNPAPDYHQIEYSYRGVDADVVFFIAINQWHDIGHFEDEIKEELNTKNKIRLSNSQIENSFADIDLVDLQAKSVSEIMYHLLINIDVDLSKDVATNLLSGIDSKSNHLMDMEITPELLEAAAGLLRLGAIRGYNEPEIGDQVQFSKSNGKVTKNEVNQNNPSVEDKNIPENYNYNVNSDNTVSDQKNLPTWMTPKIFSDTN